MEDWLSIVIDGDGRGHFVAQCTARDQPATGNTLRFGLTFDQTQLPATLASLDTVLAAYPVKGRNAATTS
jgi:hypothetical protein